MLRQAKRVPNDKGSSLSTVGELNPRESKGGNSSRSIPCRKDEIINIVTTKPNKYSLSMLMSLYYMIYSVQTHRIKIVSHWWEAISLVIRLSSLVKNTVWLIRSLIRFFSQVRKFVSVFPPFGRSCEVIESECLQRFLLSQNHGFKVCRHKFSGTI